MRHHKPTPGVLRVWQIDELFVGVLLRKDLLDAHVRDLLTHLSLNVLLVLATSNTEPFGDVVARTQRVVLLASGSLRFDSDAGRRPTLAER